MIDLAKHLTVGMAALVDPDSKAALSQLSEDDWPAIRKALEEYHNPGATEPGVDCKVAVTHETLADFDRARVKHWHEAGLRSEFEVAGRKGIFYENFQLFRGQQRRCMTVVDLGDVRVSLY